MRNDGAVRIDVLSLIGPTASGKSALAVALARRLIAGGRACEIVNTDSMLVYRGMDIGTAKPTMDERGGVVHHLIDLWDVTHTATVAEFQGLARAAIGDCQRRGVFPLLVGGSALYVRAVLDQIDFPGTDPDLRARLEGELATLGAAALHQRLRDLAPDAAAGILPQNGRRIVRALEVIELTGSFTAVLPEPRHALPGVVQAGLALDRETMDRRITERVFGMWEQGLVDEVRALVPRGIRDGLTASRALGYRQVLDFLDGRCTEDEARERTIVGTRRFARKQLGWWRRDERIRWYPAGDQRTLDELVALVDR